MTLPVRPASPGDIAAIRALLSAAGLPTEDLDTAPGLRFWVAADGPLIAGTIGLESYGTDGLLRSLVVAPSHRNRGLGAALVEALERAARAEGARLLVLLTETAEPFFGRLGYRATERAQAPTEVKRGAEFASLCPASALCMTKSLTPKTAAVPHG
jgi:amino-acid N-acetyltransferase